MESQQFHLKWNNHSLNTLSSFQHLLDTGCLVDVSLTCASGKVIPAHRMVLAACSDYFYRLFKELAEKHPVIVFKDASEKILTDLLEFMYRGEVEVDESNLSDFLKFADTLQVKGLSQGEGGNPAWKLKEDSENNAIAALARLPTSACSTPNGSVSTPRDTPPISVKDASKLINPTSTVPEPVASMNKAYHFTSALAAGLGGPGPHKFPAFFPGLPNGELPTDLYTHLTSPTLFNALKRKYPVSLGQKPGFPGVVDPESPVLKMPFLKDYFNVKHPLDLSGDARGPILYPGGLKEEDDIAERSPPASECEASLNDDSKSDQMSVGGGSTNGGQDKPNSRKPQGRGSRLERMIAAEYKILSEYSESSNGTPPEALPAITPELMKSRRTHSLQLAIGEILHNRASVQSAATKYHIPRETLRRHYQRYLKAMGINKEVAPPAGGNGNGRQSATPTKSSIETLAAAAVAAAAAGVDGSDGTPNYSSLLDIGQAYGIWAPGDDGGSSAAGSPSAGLDLAEGPRDLKIVEDEADSSQDETNENTPMNEDNDNRDDQVISVCDSPVAPATPPQNNNNVATEKPLAAPRPLPMEIV